MTREERAREWLADYFDRYGKHGGADDLRSGLMVSMTSITAVNAMLAFADAEIERAAQVADGLTRVAGSAKRHVHPLAIDTNEAWRRVEDAGLDVATAIRDLKGQP